MPRDNLKFNELFMSRSLQMLPSNYKRLWSYLLPCKRATVRRIITPYDKYMKKQTE